MKAWRWRAFLLLAVLPALVAAQSTTTRGSDERLIGAWRLVRTEARDGKPSDAPQPTGMLIYTREGHVSVQRMYPKTQAALQNEYVKDGYEASFGSYEVDEARHTVTHHVLGSNTGDALVGRDLPRLYRFTAEGRLVIQPVSSEEHWSVTWEHY
jgi:hypothetical protein